MLIAFTLGSFNFYITPLFVIGLTIVYAFLIVSFPESPLFLMRQNRISVSSCQIDISKSSILFGKFNGFRHLQDAENSMRFYQNMRGKANDFELLQLEMSKLQNSIGKPDEKCNGNSLTWSDLTRAPGRKAITIGIVLAALNQFCGCFAMLNYTANIFKEAGSNTVTLIARLMNTF